MKHTTKRKPQGEPQIPAERPGKLRLITMDDLDGRTLAARRCRELVNALASDAGGLAHVSEGTKQLIQRAAVLGTFIESCGTKWLGGEEIPLASYMSAVDRQRRLLEAIGLDRKQRTVSPSPLDYARQQREARS
jgi:hypothetical protein